jgi:glycerol-3-phosphate dehydrogenase
VFGGKLTTYRRLGEEAVDRLAEILPTRGGAWTSRPDRPLPGGARRDIDALQRELQQRHPWLPDAMAWRLGHDYGTRSATVLGQAGSLAELGEHFGADLYRAEVDYLRDHEWARCAEAILWRRGKFGLRIGATEAARLDAYLAGAPASAAPPSGGQRHRA